MTEFLVILVLVALIIAALKTTRQTEQQGRRRRENAARDHDYTSECLDSLTAEPAPLKWLGQGEVLQVKGFEIQSPFTYLSNGRGHAQDPSEINRSLRVTEANKAEDLSYWPWYSRLAPQQRYIYLRWMASGRDKLPPNDGYLFIYYYGLERRALADDADHKLVFSEVQRLRTVYAKHGGERRGNSFMNYSSAFLWLLAAWKPELIRVQRVEVLAKRTRVWSEDKLAAALAWFVQCNQTLPAWMAYVVAEESPHSQRSVVTRRINKEFRTLFARRYREEFGEGLVLRTAKRDRKIIYQPATAVMSEASITIPNALGISSQFKKLAAIWNRCIQDLRKLSSVARSHQEGELTAARWEAMPPELRAQVDHPLTQAICDVVAENSDEDGHVFVRARDVGSILKLEDRARFTPSQSRQIAATADHVGFAVEPDARLTGKAYASNELLAVFPQAYEGQPDKNRYCAAACMLRLGIAIAEADGRTDEDELNHVAEHIENGFDLNEHERRRLEALRSLLLQTGSDIAGLGRLLKAVLDVNGRKSVGRLLVAVAAVDGVITQGELKALRRCYRALDLSKEEMETTLKELARTKDDGPVTVLRGRSRPPGEAIPGPSKDEETVRLDRGVISRIMHETREVSALLAEAMNVEGAGIETVAATETTELSGDRKPDSNSRVLDKPPSKNADVAGVKPAARYVAFYDKIVQRREWTRAEAEDLARQHGHMLAGVIEVINEWGFERFDGQLIYDDGDLIEIDQELARGSS